MNKDGNPRTETTLPREAYAAMTERSFQAQVVQLAKLYGWSVYFAWTSMHSPSGLPDLTMVRPPRVLFAELKGPRGKLAPAQEATIRLLRACPGVECHVWWPWDIDRAHEVLR